MRSLLIQASSVEKAVEKAWSDAGMPTEFKIKVLDFGEKGFFGMTKKPAIVSIFYEPQRQTSLSRPQQSQPQRKNKARNDKRPPKPSRQGTKEAPKKPMQRTQQKPRQQQEKPRQQQAPQKAQMPERIFWTDALIQDVSSWLKELTATLGITTPFKTQVNRKVLTITFEGSALESQDEERLLFSGLSYLLVQFLKKQNKKKYQGYQLVLTSKRFKKQPPRQ